MKNSGLQISKLPAIAVAFFCALSLTAHSGVSEWKTKLNSGVAEFNRGEHQRAAASLAAAVKEAEALGESDERLALTLNIWGGQYLVQRDYTAAEPLLKRSLAIRERIFGTEHPDVARVQNSLAVLYFAQGKYEEAEPLLRSALAIWETALGRDHPDVAALLDNFAMLYAAQGKYAQAESLFRRSGTIWEKVGDAKNIAMSKSNIEQLYTKMANQAQGLAPQSTFSIQYGDR